MTVLAEPSPLHTVGRLYHAGRGGAGNYHRLATAPLPPPPTTIVATPSTRFFGGRGGAGNAHLFGERAMFSFDEELEHDRLLQENHAPVYSVGRGGAGNIVASSSDSRSVSSSSPRSSTESVRSDHSLRGTADRVLSRISKIRSHASQ